MDTFLRSHRIRREIRPADLARTVGVHPMSILRWERRERLPGSAHIRVLADALQLDPARVAAFFDAARRPADDSGPSGRGLRAIRRAAGVSAATIARRLGVGVSTVYNWESGRARIPSDVITPLGDLLGIPGERLVERLSTSPTRAGRPPTHSPLRRMRARSGLSQERAARAAGVHRQSLGAWERGEGTPPLAVVRRLARTYGRSVADAADAAGVAPPPLLAPQRWRPGDLPEVLRTLRDWTGLTQRDLARRCRCSVATIRAWEAGRSAPSSRLRRRTESVFGLAPGSLRAAISSDTGQQEEQVSNTHPIRDR